MSRFATFPRAAAACVLIVAAALIALGLPSSIGIRPIKPIAGSRDFAVYDAVVARVRRGQPYEAAAVAEQRLAHYPVRPFVAVRPPALAVALSFFPSDQIADRLLALLAAAVILAWTIRLRRLRDGLPWTAAVALIVFTGMAVTMAGAGIGVLHEAWAGLLIALSLALRTRKRFGAAVILGLMAALIRELAAPYLVVMALMAVVDRKRWEAAAFSAALAVTLAALAWHAQAVMALTTRHDLVSPGWIGLGGWPFIIQLERWNLLVEPLTAAAFAPLALLGAAGWKDGAGLRLFLLLAGYILGFMVIGRPENIYWGFMIAPLLAVGLCLSPLALIDLSRRALHPAPGVG